MIARPALFISLLLSASGCEDYEPSNLDAADAGQKDSGLGVDAEAVDLGPADFGPGDLSSTDGTTPEVGPTDSGDPGCGALTAAQLDDERYNALLGCLARSELDDELKDDLVLEFVDLVEAQNGFPIQRASGTFIFVYVRRAELDAEDDQQVQEDFQLERRQEPIRVAFDLANLGSNTQNLELKHRAFFAAELAVSNPAGQPYRLVAKDTQGADWFYSDPLSRRFQFDGEGRYSLVRGAANVGHLEWIRRVHATRLAVDRPIYLYVPPAYDDTTQRYSVLYMHDGNNLFHPDIPNSAPVGTWNLDTVMQQQLAGGHVRPGLIVGVPNNANRVGEYTHVEDDLGQVLGGDGDDYADFIANDLKPIIDARYRTLSDRNNTGVMGSSLGGLISFHIGALYPERFRFVGGLSSTLGWGRFGLANPNMVERYAALADLGGRDQVFYLDSGGGPEPKCPDSRDGYCEALQMRDTLVTAGVDQFAPDPDASPLPAGTNIMHWWTPNAPHSESAWSARVHRPLRLFFRPN